jgi:hypothetical protein
LKLSKGIDHRKARSTEYPDIGSQLDAIMKGFAHLRENGYDIGDEADAWVDECLAVKNKFKNKEQN